MEPILERLRNCLNSEAAFSELQARQSEAESEDHLVRLAAAIRAEEVASFGPVRERLSSAPARLSHDCRTVLSLLLLGRTLDEAAGEREEIAACAGMLGSPFRQAPQFVRPLLLGYAADVLTSEQQAELFGSVLSGGCRFDLLAEAEAVRQALADPAFRAEFLHAIENQPFTVAGGFRQWFDRPRARILVAIGFVLLLAILVQGLLQKPDAVPAAPLTATLMKQNDSGAWVPADGGVRTNDLIRVRLVAGVAGTLRVRGRDAQLVERRVEPGDEVFVPGLRAAAGEQLEVTLVPGTGKPFRLQITLGPQ